MQYRDRADYTIPTKKREQVCVWKMPLHSVSLLFVRVIGALYATATMTSQPASPAQPASKYWYQRYTKIVRILLGQEWNELGT